MKFSRLKYGRMVLLFSSALGCACVAQSGEEAASEGDSVGRHSSELYYDADGVWSSPSISVCWKSSSYATERGWVRQAVEKAIEAHSDVNFTGWGTCSGSGAEIAIEFDNDEWPRAAVGERTASSTPNMWLNPFSGAPQDLDDDGFTDFATCYSGTPGSGNPSTGITGESWPTYRQRCIEVVAVHEFFHSLSVHHEQGRSDTPGFCSPDQTIPGETEYGYWDLTSVSNYCNPAWSGDGLLSPLDISGMIELYGENENDQVWYSVGNVADYGWASIDQMMFAIQSTTLSGDYEPVIGDFDGDGNDDVFYYGVGSLPDRIRWGDSDRTFDIGSVDEVNGTYVAVSGDFDGDGYDDIFFYGPGSATDRVRWGRADRTFEGTAPLTIDGSSYVPLTGDFDGDGYDDIFLYAPGSVNEYVRWGRSDRTFDTGNAPSAIDGTYQPIAGDFDGDGYSDVFLYNPGSATDRMRWGRADRGFDGGSAPTVNGTYDTTAGDFNGDGITDVIWSGSSESDNLWLFESTRGSYAGSKTSSVTDAKPFAGDFDGDGLSDVLWYEEG